MARACKRIDVARAPALDKLLIQPSNASAPLRVPLAARHDLDSIREASSHVLGELERCCGVHVARDEHRRHRGSHGIPITHGKRRLRPMLTGGLLLADTVVPQERVPGGRRDIGRRQEGHVLGAGDREEESRAIGFVETCGLRENSLDDRRPVAGMRAVNEPGHCRGGPRSVELRAQPLDDPAATQSRSGNRSRKGYAHGAGIQALQKLVELRAQIRKGSAASGIAGAGIERALENGLRRFRHGERRYLVDRHDAPEIDGADARRVRAQVNLCRTRPVRPREEVELVVAEGPAHLLQVAGEVQVGVLSEVRAPAQIGRAGLHGGRRKEVTQVRCRSLRIVQVAAQDAGLARSALVHQQEITVLAKRYEPLGELPTGADGVFTRTTHQRHDRIRKRPAAARGNHDDCDPELRAIRLVRILGNHQLTAARRRRKARHDAIRQSERRCDGIRRKAGRRCQGDECALPGRQTGRFLRGVQLPCALSAALLDTAGERMPRRKALRKPGRQV